ncbi:polysaccharide deacetylase family protein [Streptomyces sp. MST-110588]|uniref:polysaccharide deacetylase family protein n=1 Tax=Streptomyces sp. MST-110588 TaxID=2833628 RepID=UPI001F5D83F3|nr:polysaccharide deacetylase family protein [Streptomyces sp. MST-110588]UNO39354.1 polysaccharide deacetylase family protein [Streptomyces sp. MST-110588]
MWIAALAWDARGYEVVCVHTGGGGLTPWRVGAGQVDRLIARLKDLAASGGEEVAAVVESTNGLLDGPLLAAGLPVFRADPWLLPRRPHDASVGAGDLARHALASQDALVRLTTRTGTLAGRAGEMERHIEECAPAERELARRGLYVRRGPASAPKVALTFDDGPCPPYTGEILDVLRVHQVPATFFCVGLHADAHPEVLERIAAQGHHIGNHTWSHPYLPDLTRAELDFQIDATNRAVRRVTGTEPRLLRPPYGSRTPEVLRWLADRGMTTVLWDNDPCDWAVPGAEAIAGAVVEQTRNGSIVLMHDGGGDRSQTVAALPGIIGQLAARGHEFVTADEIATSL